MTEQDKHNVVVLAQGKVPPTPAVLFFSATAWDQASRDMSIVFQELSRKYPLLPHFQVEAEDHPDLSEGLEVDAVPTFILYQDGIAIERVEGANAPGLHALVAKYANSVDTSALLKASTSRSNQETAITLLPIKARIERLISSAPVMLFMKGTPDAPQCGFSRQVVGLFDDLKLAYGSYNILADEELRAALKEYSEWPTYPQIYYKGTLIGGLDILKEMIASGEFQQLVSEFMGEAPANDDEVVEVEADEGTDLNPRLQRLITASKIMLFMKGNRSTPKCGFSRQIVALLEGLDAKYKTFDILTNEEVRQGLKAFSSWPTYPQLYINGELVGGLDIVKEMIETGDLQQMLA